MVGSREVQAEQLAGQRVQVQVQEQEQVQVQVQVQVREGLPSVPRLPQSSSVTHPLV